METLPAEGSLVEALAGQSLAITAEIEAGKARIVRLRRDLRILARAIAALQRGDGLQPALVEGDGTAPIRPVTHAALAPAR